MATAHAEQETANPVAVIRQNLTQMQPEFKAALPPHITPERFTRVAMTAIQNTPSLVQADRRSLFGAFVKLAQDGLLPDGREAAVVIYGGKAQAMPMIAGILKKIRQSGEVASVDCQVVYANDKFTYRPGIDEQPIFEPDWFGDRGKPIGAYAIATLKSGEVVPPEIMNFEQIEKVRAVSRAAKNGPWVAWWSEMARKTVMRRFAKRLPSSTDIEDQIFGRDDTLTVDVDAVREISREPEAEVVPMNRLDAIEHQIDGETGEIIEEPEPPEESQEIGEQADELEAEIEEEAEQSPDVNDEADPAREAAGRLIRTFDKAQLLTDLGAYKTEAAEHIAAMPPEYAAEVEEAYERNKVRLGGKAKAAVQEPAK